MKEKHRERSNMRIPVAKDGLPIIISLFVTGVALGKLVNWNASIPVFAAGFFSIWFFRDPERVIPFQANAIVSPADGTVIKVEEVDDGKYLKEKAKKVSIFMSIFNVHVNRIPYDGVVEEIRYNPGRFFVASRDKASEENEQNAIILDMNGKGKMAFVQIAGFVARRIVCHIKKGDRVTRGSRFGMIRFGSRLDVYMPANVQVVVALGNKVRAGESILGYL